MNNEHYDDALYYFDIDTHVWNSYEPIGKDNMPIYLNYNMDCVVVIPWNKVYFLGGSLDGD